MGYSSREVYPSEYDEPCICEVCKKEENDCKCPECPNCGIIGSPSCVIENHFSEELRKGN